MIPKDLPCQNAQLGPHKLIKLWIGVETNLVFREVYVEPNTKQTMTRPTKAPIARAVDSIWRDTTLRKTGSCISVSHTLKPNSTSGNARLRIDIGYYQRLG